MVRSPGILYGTAWKRGDTAALVSKAVGLGFRGIDTACQPRHYNEAGVGAGLLECLNRGLARTELYLQTKFTPVSGQDPATVPYDPRSPLPEQVAQSCAVSLRNLRTDYLDGLILHSPLPDADDTLQVWRAFEQLVDRGTVRQLGISNCYRLGALEGLWKAARVKPAVLQNRFHAASGYDRGLREFCRTHEVSYQSFWTLTANPHVLAHATLAGLSARRARTPEQLLFRYLTQIGIVPLSGTRSEAHMHEDLAIFDFELDDAECAALAAIF
jgi:diketogulonate reductase-like aldo/keto reductase